MSTRSATQTALGAALALAITLTTAIAPAFADGPQFEQADPGSTIDAVDSGLKFEQVKPPSIVDIVDTNPQPTFKPDVLVSFKGQSSSGGNTLYRFKVENVGIETANNIGLGNVVYQHSNTSNLSKRMEGSSGTIATLATGQSEEITVTCTPFAGYHCTSGSVKANLANDLNPNNNSAHS